MLKNVFLSTVAVASLSLSQSHAMTSDDMIGDNPSSSSSSSTSSKPTKLQPVVTEAFLNSPNLNNSHKEDGTFDHDNNLLKEVFVQPLMDTLLHLASPCHRNPRGRYISHLDICHLIDAFYPLKSRFVRNMNWYKQVFYQPDVTDAYLTKEKLTREVYDHFWTESQAWFDAEVYKTVTSMLESFSWDTIEIAASRIKLTQLATSQLLKKGTFQKQLDKGYEAYRMLVRDLKTRNVGTDSLNFEDKSLTVLPPATLWSPFTALREIDLKSNQISDLGFLEPLTTLQVLDLTENQITDISSLEHLTSLRNLGLNRNKASGLGSLEKLTALKSLWLNKNQISDSDLRFIEPLTTLEELYLVQNQISNLSSLENLTPLISLGLNRNKISDLRPCQGLTSLRCLYLADNQISGLSSLENLTALQILWLNHNQISDSDLRHLSRLTGLQDLFLEENQISNLRSLEPLRALHILSLDNNPTLWAPLASENREVSESRIAANYEFVKTLRNRRGCDVRGVPEIQN